MFPDVLFPWFGPRRGGGDAQLCLVVVCFGNFGDNLCRRRLRERGELS